MRKIGLIVLLAAFFCELHGQAIPDNIFFEHIPVPGTIKSSLTEDIVQDEYGMMWIAKDVLYRYDGKEFRKYDVISNDSSLFSAREITMLYWDTPEHRLLIGTRNFGVVEYRYENDRLERLPTRHGRPIVSDIARTPSGILVTSMTSGFFQLRGDTLMRADSLSGVKWPSRMLVKNNDVWVSCQNEVVVVKGSKIAQRISFETIPALAGGNVRASCVHFDHLGHLWIGTERDGIAVLDTTTMQVVKSFPHNQYPFYNAIVRISQDRDKLFWIATKGDGLVAYSSETDKFKQLISNDRTPGSIKGDHCTSTFIDQSGVMWVGTSGEINKYDKDQVKFAHFSHDPYNSNSLSDDNIRGLFFDSDDKIYACTSAGFLNLVDRRKNLVERYKPTFSGPPVTPLCIASYDKDNLLIGSNKGLLLFNKVTHRFSYFTPLESLTRGYNVRQVIHHRKNIYLLLRGSVVRYQTETGKVTSFNERHNIKGASALTVDHRNRLWAGIEGGVAYMGDSAGKCNIITLTQDEVRPDSSFFLALSLEQVGNQMWVNSFNNGVYVIDLDQNPPRLTERITTRTGLIDNTVYATIPDNNDNVWITHNSGLTRYNLHDHKFIHFSVSEGLQGEEFNRLAFASTYTGEIAIGGTNGINVFAPGKISIKTAIARVRLVDVTAFAVRSFDAGPMYVPLLDGLSQLKVAHDYNSLRFSFFVPDYREPSRIEVSYKLEPFDKDWVATDKFYTHTYANLLPGTYTFAVKAVSLSGDETVSTVRINVTPPYWKTWWFLGLAAVVVSFLVYSVIYSRIQSNKRETRRLEALLKSRTREIEQSREELANLNRKKDLIFSILSHDLRSPLTTLKGFLGLLIDNSDSLTKDELQKYATNIRNSVTTSLDLIDNTLFWSLSQTGNIQCVPTHVPVGPLFDKIRNLYQLTADKKQITINYMSVNGLAVHADENMVYVLLRNLVSNAIKFTPEMNSISIDAVQQGALVSIRIKDHGVGMTQQEVENIFTLDNPIVKKGTSSEKGTGLGLLLCKKFVEVNHGKLLIESKPGEGSSFTVILPAA
jgi:signal transduction histidine kinase/ligand-binding sensor domain-containing protein